MNQDQKQFYEKYIRQIHRLGRFMLIVSIIMFIFVPFFYGIINDAMPDFKGFLAGLAKVAIVYVPVSIVEFLVYVPMLGAGGSYLAFLTGNVTNLKIPCAINSKDITKVEDNTPESEIVSTLSIATSAIVTMAVIVVGVLLMVPLQPVLQNPVLTPAFDMVVPALFGALGFKYFLKSPKIAVVPLLVMTLLCIFVPSMISQTSVLMIPAGVLALGIGFLLFKKGKL